MRVGNCDVRVRRELKTSTAKGVVRQCSRRIGMEIPGRSEKGKEVCSQN